MSNARGLEEVGVAQRRSAVRFAPLVERFQHRGESLALLGQEILVARRVRFIEPSRDDTLTFKALEPCRERVRRETRQALLEVAKAQRSEPPQIAKDQQRPSFANHI